MNRNKLNTQPRLDLTTHAGTQHLLSLLLNITLVLKPPSNHTLHHLYDSSFNFEVNSHITFNISYNKLVLCKHHRRIPEYWYNCKFNWLKPGKESANKTYWNLVEKMCSDLHFDSFLLLSIHFLYTEMQWDRSQQKDLLNYSHKRSS
jgi:hypothetical protein